MSAAVPDDVASTSRVDALADVTGTFVGLIRAFSREKARMPHHDVEFASHALLRILGVEGPSRVSALADWAGYDASTVSRQVAALEKDGLVVRTADVADRRACLVEPTDAGRAVIAGYDASRREFFGEMLASWDEHDLGTFAALLDRFRDSFDHVGRPSIARRRAEAAGTHSLTDVHPLPAQPGGTPA